jgi:hypothetical protein
LVYIDLHSPLHNDISLNGGKWQPNFQDSLPMKI